MGEVIPLQPLRVESVKLGVNHSKGLVYGDGQPPQDFGDRLARIKTSLEKINQLTAELKKQGRD